MMLGDSLAYDSENWSTSSGVFLIIPLGPNLMGAVTSVIQVSVYHFRRKASCRSYQISMESTKLRDWLISV